MTDAPVKAKKNLVICNFPRFSGEIWLPVLWAQCKTFYELHGQNTHRWNWVPCVADLYSVDYKEQIKSLLEKSPPDVLAISLYVWNFTLAHDIAQWAKTRWPRCLVVTGGPHQYFKHDINWFRTHWYIDASLPGDCYGEQCLLEILDQYDTVSARVDWSKITDIYYPVGNLRRPTASALTMTRAQKKNYPYNWAALHAQHSYLTEFVQHQQEIFPDSILLSVIETTRGCPYGCTYCDWGGGTNTSVIKKPFELVKQDIDAVTEFDLTYLYFADANFGIFGQRDVDIIDYLAKVKHQKRKFFKTGYGGFAKTENRLEYIREILRIDVNNELSLTKELKLSMQSLDPVVLDNIDRKNIDLDKQLEVYGPLAANSRLPLYVEMIMGLPGMTLDKYYHELDVMGQHALTVQWFEWILLPETPAFGREYRDRYGLKTIQKKKGWAVLEENSDREVVVGAASYSTDHYLQMLLSSSFYHLIVQGGFYQGTFQWIMAHDNLRYGDIIRDLYENWFAQSVECSQWRQDIVHRWQEILADPDVSCTAVIDGEHVYLQWYFVMLAFTQQNHFDSHLITWCQHRYAVPQTVIDSDRELALTANNLGLRQWQGFNIVDFGKGRDYVRQTKIQTVESLFRNYVKSGDVLRGTKKFLGIV